MNKLTLFKRLLIKEHMPMQKTRIKKCLLHLVHENNHDDGVISILMHGIQPHIYFIFCFKDHKLYKFEWFFTNMWILCGS
jgi:hypothetical protein